jgi:hypothetical protein
MLRRLLRPFSEVQDSFLKYIRRAEEIDLKVKQEEQKKGPDSGPKPQQSESVNSILQKLMTFQQLSNARSRERVQLVIEEAFASVSQQYRKDPQGSVSVQALAEHLLFLWQDRPELRLVELGFNEVMRSILIAPASEKMEYVGEFSRVTKAAKQQLNPVVYGPLGSIAYLATIKGCAKMLSGGVKALRRTIDHMASYDHVPSQEIIHAVAAECVAGKWPATALAFMRYVIKKKITVTSTAFVDTVILLRKSTGFFDQSLELAKECIESGCQSQPWPVMEPIIQKYIKHLMVKESNAFVNDCLKIAGRAKTSEVPAEQEKHIKDTAFTIQTSYIKHLLKANLVGDSFVLYSKWLANNKSKEAISIGLNVFEKVGDSASAVKFLETIQKQKDFEVDRSTLISILKIARNAETLGVTMADKHLSHLFSPRIYSPFALNLVIMIYGPKNLRKIAEVCARVVDNEFHVNHFTFVTLSKILRSVPDSGEREELVAQFKRMSFPEAPQSAPGSS